MINGLKGLTNLSLPQKLIRSIMIKLFKTKIKLGQSLPRASKLEANKILFQKPVKDSKASASASSASKRSDTRAKLEVTSKLNSNLIE